MKKQIITGMVALAITMGGVAAPSMDFVNVTEASAVTTSTSKTAPTKLAVSVKKTVYVGEKYQMSVKSVTPANASKSVSWKTSDTSVATVNSKGEIVGKKAGTVTVTATSTLNKKVKTSCKVAIKDYSRKVMNIDNSESLVFNVKNGDYSKLDTTKIIRTYDELNAYKKYVKRNYPTYKKVIAQLNEYDVEYFNDKTLCCTLTVTQGTDAKYIRGDVYGAVKKFANGKLTTYIKTSESLNIPSDEMISTEVYTRFQCSFVTLDGVEAKNVKQLKVSVKSVEGKDFNRVEENFPVVTALDKAGYDFSSESDLRGVISSTADLDKIKSTVESSYEHSENTLAALAKYDDEFFKTKSLYVFRNYEQGYSYLEYYDYTFRPTVLKMVQGVVGIYIKPNIDFNVPAGVEVNDQYVGRSTTYIVELDKELAEQIEAGRVM